MFPALRLVLLAVLLVLVPAASAQAWVAPCEDRDGPNCRYWKGKVVFIGDGDTVDVDVAGDGTSKVRRVRLIGANAMELTRYSKFASRRRGDCHGVEAAAMTERLVRASGWRVRLSAQDSQSANRGRPMRTIEVRVNGRWQYLAEILLREGHALWMAGHEEWAHNNRFRRAALAGRAAAKNLHDPSYCGGNTSEIDPKLALRWDADGIDQDNANGEWATITNPSPTPLPLDRWHFRDSGLRRFTFPPGTVLPGDSSIRLYMGCGSASPTRFFWCQPTAVFENATFDERGMGDGGYLFDTQGDLRASAIYPS